MVSCKARSLAFCTAASRSAFKVCRILFSISSGLRDGGFGGWLGGVTVDVVGSD